MLIPTKYLIRSVIGLVTCVLLCGAENAPAQVPEWKTMDLPWQKGATFQGTYEGVGIGAVGIHRSRGKLMVTRTYYESAQAGIFIHFIDKKWMTYDDFVRSYDREACIHHIIRINSDKFTASPGEDPKLTVRDYLTNPQTIRAMKASETRNVWFYCRFAIFKGKTYTAMIPIDRFKGTATHQKLTRKYESYKQTESSNQAVFLGSDIGDYNDARDTIYRLLPMTPFGPDWMAMDPGGLRAEYIRKMQKTMLWNFETAKYRYHYMVILENAR